MNQRRLDQLIVQSRRRHRAKMERLGKNFLGKRAEDGVPQLGTLDDRRQRDTEDQQRLSEGDNYA